MRGHSGSYSYSERLRRRRYFFLAVFVFALTILVYSLISNFLFKTYKVESGTMNPSYAVGDYIGVTPLFDAEEEAKRGVLVIRKPLYDEKLNVFQRVLNAVAGSVTFRMFRPFDKTHNPATKNGLFRIVAIPGDSIFMKDYVLYIRPKNTQHFLSEFEVADIQYDLNIDLPPKNWKNDLPFSGNLKKLTLKDDEYFLLCDNRTASVDSRYWGPVKSDEIAGKVLFKYWPFRSSKNK